MSGEGGVSQRVAAVLEEAGTSLWRRKPFVIATTLALGVTLAFPALLVAVLSGLVEGADALASGERLRAYLTDAATVEEVRAVERRLRAVPGLTTVEHVDRDAARAALVARHPDLARAARALTDEELALPASVEARGTASPEALEALAREIAEMPGVDDVRYDAAAASALAAAADRLRLARLALVVVALAATGFALANVIRIGALARREQLAIMRLVGAPRVHVRAPFVIEGAVQGGAAGVLAGGLLLAARAAATALVPGVPLLPEGLGLAGWATLVGGPAVAGALAAAIALESVLRHHAQIER